MNDQIKCKHGIDEDYCQTCFVKHEPSCLIYVCSCEALNGTVKDDSKED
jgi:hypothetical protein